MFTGIPLQDPSAAGLHTYFSAYTVAPGLESRPGTPGVFSTSPRARTVMVLAGGVSIDRCGYGAASARRLEFYQRRSQPAAANRAISAQLRAGVAGLAGMAVSRRRSVERSRWAGSHIRCRALPSLAIRDCQLPVTSAGLGVTMAPEGAVAHDGVPAGGAHDRVGAAGADGDVTVTAGTGQGHGPRPTGVAAPASSWRTGDHAFVNRPGSGSFRHRCKGLGRRPCAGWFSVAGWCRGRRA